MAAFADPGLSALKQLLPDMPCIGLGEAAWGAVASGGMPFGIVSGGAATIPETQRAAEAVGLADHLVGIHLISRPLSSIIDTPRETVADALRGIKQIDTTRGKVHSTRWSAVGDHCTDSYS